MTPPSNLLVSLVGLLSIAGLGFAAPAEDPTAENLRRSPIKNLPQELCDVAIKLKVPYLKDECNLQKYEKVRSPFHLLTPKRSCLAWI